VPTARCLLPSPLGTLSLTADSSGRISSLRIAPHLLPAPEVDRVLFGTVAEELRAYFEGRSTEFTVPIVAQGTEFQRSAWKVLAAVPYGETRTYREIAAAMGSPHAARAVGQALNRNPIAIIVPCHRVVGSRGELTGYSGGIAAKRFLLDLEAKVTGQSPTQDRRAQLGDRLTKRT
jgi:methylated-DNA-[protein]-cysteine S-methyltransferase